MAVMAAVRAHMSNALKETTRHYRQGIADLGARQSGEESPMKAESLQLLNTSAQLLVQNSFAAAEQAVIRAQALLEVIMLHQADEDEAPEITAAKRMLEDMLQACRQGLSQKTPQSTSVSPGTIDNVSELLEPIAEAGSPGELIASTCKTVAAALRAKQKNSGKDTLRSGSLPSAGAEPQQAGDSGPLVMAEYLGMSDKVSEMMAEQEFAAAGKSLASAQAARQDRDASTAPPTSAATSASSDLPNGIADMLEQWEAKAEQAGTLADKKEYVAAAKIAAECVALAETCGASVSQRTTLVEFHESLEQMATFQREVAPRIRHKMRSIQSGSHDADKLNPENSAAMQLRDKIKQELQDAASSKESNQQQHASSAAADTSGLGPNQDAAVQKEIDLLMAQSDYQRAQWLPPSHHDAIAAAQLVLRVANLKFLVNDFRGAAADLTTAEHLQPGDVATLQLRGRIRMKLRDYSGAAEDLSNTADSAELLKLRGTARFCVGQIEGAFADIARADSLDPGLADKFTEMLEKAFEKYGDPAEEYMAGQIAALKAMLKDTHNA
ncbi:hypothetical protein WJX82_008328 [Trebouxia sp. C0006]